MSDANMGRPSIPNYQYENWLDDMRAFLQLGESLNCAIDDAGLRKHRTAIYEKFRENGDFTDKINAYREYPGKLANNILVRILFQVDEKIRRGIEATPEEMKNVRFFAEKHRSAQAYFVRRTEVFESSIDDILSGLTNDYEQKQEESYNQVSEEAKQSLNKA